MENIHILGVDLAKRTFAICGADKNCYVNLRQKLTRPQFQKVLSDLPPCIVAMEACGSAHHWGRIAQAAGHEVRLIPALYVKPFVKRHKNDALDAEAIAEAASRPSMRTVAVKDEEQQAQAMLFRTREMFVRQRTQLINAVRAHLAEYGIVLPQQRRNGRLFAERCRAEFGTAPEAVISMVEAYLRRSRPSIVKSRSWMSKSRKAHCATLTRGDYRQCQELGRCQRWQFKLSAPLLRTLAKVATSRLG